MGNFNKIGGGETNQTQKETLNTLTELDKLFKKEFENTIVDPQQKVWEKIEEAINPGEQAPSDS